MLRTPILTFTLPPFRNYDGHGKDSAVHANACDYFIDILFTDAQVSFTVHYFNVKVKNYYQRSNASSTQMYFTLLHFVIFEFIQNMYVECML